MDFVESSVGHLQESIENRCRTQQIGELCCYDGNPATFWYIWRVLEIPKQYRTQEPFYNLVIWNSSSKHLAIHLETKASIEAKKDRIIPSNALELSSDESDEEQCTIWKYS